MDKLEISRINRLTFSLSDDELEMLKVIFETFAVAGTQLAPDYPAAALLAESLLYKLKGK